MMLIPVAVRSKAWVCVCLLAGIAGGTNVCVFWVVCFQVEISAMARCLIQRSPTTCVCVCVRERERERERERQRERDKSVTRSCIKLDTCISAYSHWPTPGCIAGVINTVLWVSPSCGLLQGFFWKCGYCSPVLVTYRGPMRPHIYLPRVFMYNVSLRDPLA
jgi:hypothetical protein